ncbi:MAG TPA: GTPase Era [Anaerolineales bacterium]|nr:GTPase Era [Anaerolineales bacterium]HRQ92746.1 GTPase Era [Anaerolineales bacterium]
MTFKAGYVSVLGRPNVGKSTLMNALLGQKVAAVSSKPQTTRRNQLGIVTNDTAQIIFVDTPGIHQRRSKLGDFMNADAFYALDDGDVLLFMVDASTPPTDEDRSLAERLAARQRQQPLLLVLNKVDLLTGEERTERRQQYGELVPGAQFAELSAVSREGLPELMATLEQQLPEGDPFYPPDQVTDFWERQIAADLIREAALKNLREEVPHGIAIRIDEFVERGDEGAKIDATIFVERDSHKGIVVGEGGRMIKKIGQAAREEIEKMSERKVFLELRVKVNEGWRDDERELERMGYARRKD